jgi:dUTP pyrophosphatase
MRLTHSKNTQAMAKPGIICTGNPPEYAHDGDAGADLRSNEEVTLQPGERALVGTGFRMALPDNNVAMLCSRSGLAHKNGIMVVNSPGIIDSGYRGEVKVNLINLGSEPFVIEKRMRIAQLVIVPFIGVQFLPVARESFDVLDRTERGTGGHGSSGV